MNLYFKDICYDHVFHPLHQKVQKILPYSTENTDVLFEHSDVKVDTSNVVFLLMSFLKKDVQRVMLIVR